MVSNEVRELAISIVDDLFAKGFEEHFPHCFWDWMDDTLIEFGYWAADGMTKLCIGRPDLRDWVIKVAYDGREVYSANEYEVYCAAEEAGFSHYLPETVYLCERAGKVFYLQQKAWCHEESITSDWCERLRKTYEENECEYDEDDLYCELDSLEDKERVMLSFNDLAFWDFLKQHHVNDLHEGNFGYIDGHLVIIDFSGFGWA